jgi:hypothetical protein
VGSEIVAGVLGAAVGSLFTAGGTWGVSFLLDRRHEQRELLGALRLVRGEVAENAARLQNDDTVGTLTYGDWSRAKVVLANLPDQQLREELRTVYRLVYELAKNPRDRPSDAALARRLEKLDKRLADTISGS